MRKTLLLPAIILIYTHGFAQKDSIDLEFDTKYYEAVDEWVVFPKKKMDTTYTYGFIYIDEMAGFTFDYKSKFKIEKGKLVDIPRKDSLVGGIKYRLQSNTALVAILSQTQIEELGLPDKPDWLSVYKSNSDKVSYLKNIGYHYNHVGASKLALKPLLKAYEKKPHFEELEFELAYAYNATGQFDKAVSVLEKAIKKNPNNPMLYRELGFAYLRLDKIKEAEKTYLKGIKLSKDDFQKSEMAVNMAQAHFMMKNREKFDEWARLTRKYAKEGSRYAQFIDLFEKKWDEER